MGATAGSITTTGNKFVNSNAGMRASASSSLLGMNAQSAQRKNGFQNNMGGPASQPPRQSSQGPSHNHTQANVVQSVPTNYSHLKTTSRDFQNTGQIPQKSTMHESTGKTTSATMLGPQASSQQHFKYANSNNSSLLHPPGMSQSTQN